MVLSICVPIQIKRDNLNEIKSNIDVVKQFKPNYIEFRLDYINNTSLLTDEFVKRIVKSSQDAETKIILTYRKASEGGQADINEEERLKIVKTIINALPDYVDVEMSSNDDFIKETISLAIQKRVRMIFSYHDFVRTPSLNEIKHIITNFDTRLVKNLSIGEKNTGSFPIKMIFTAQKFVDNLIPIKLSQELSRMQRNVITFCMGELGIFSRVSCVKYGSLFTFASIGDTTAPGQISLEQMRETHKVLYISDQ